jgi:hypothetical protein
MVNLFVKSHDRKRLSYCSFCHGHSFHSLVISSIHYLCFSFIFPTSSALFIILLTLVIHLFVTHQTLTLQLCHTLIAAEISCRQNTDDGWAGSVRPGSAGRASPCCYSRRWQAEQMESPSLPPATIGLIKLEQYNSVLTIAELWSHFILQMAPQHFLFMK